MTHVGVVVDGGSARVPSDLIRVGWDKFILKTKNKV